MSDNIPLNTQRACTEGDYYVVDLFSNVQPPVYGNRGSLNQLIVYITSASENSSRLAFMQVYFSLHKKINSTRTLVSNRNTVQQV